MRDTSLTGLAGRYLYGDLCRDDLRTLDLEQPGADPCPAGLSIPPADRLLGFGEDGHGHIYVLTSETAYRVAADATVPESCSTPGDPDRDPPAEPGPGAAGPAAAADTRRPGLRYRVSAQRLRRHVVIYATCLEDCVMRAHGVLKFSGEGSRAAHAKLVATTRSGQAATRVRLQLQLYAKALKRARSVLKAKRRVSASVAITATDAAGNTTRKKTRLRVTR